MIYIYIYNIYIYIYKDTAMEEQYIHVYTYIRNQLRTAVLWKAHPLFSWSSRYRWLISSANMGFGSVKRLHIYDHPHSLPRHTRVYIYIYIIQISPLSSSSYLSDVVTVIVINIITKTIWRTIIYGVITYSNAVFKIWDTNMVSTYHVSLVHYN